MIAQILWGYNVVALFGTGTVLIAVAVSVPQFVHIRRGAGVAGVSLPAVTNSALSFLAWTVYALAIGDGWLIASSAIGLPFAVATAVAAWRYGAPRTGMWVTGLWALILLLTCMVEAAGTADPAHVVVGASIGWLVVPAVATAWRSADVSGISAGSWWVLAAEGSLFLGYGIAHAVTAPVVYGVVALAGSGAVLGRLALGRRLSEPLLHASLAAANRTGGSGASAGRRASAGRLESELAAD